MALAAAGVCALASTVTNAPYVAQRTDRGASPRHNRRMKTILDSSFRYTPSFDTDIRRTFARIRETQKAAVAASPAVHLLNVSQLPRPARAA